MSQKNAILGLAEDLTDDDIRALRDIARPSVEICDEALTDKSARVTQAKVWCAAEVCRMRRAVHGPLPEYSMWP